MSTNTPPPLATSSPPPIPANMILPPPPSRGGAITPSLLRRACTRDGAGRCDGQKGIVDVAVVDQLKARTRKCRLDKGSHLPGNPVQSLWNINNQSMYKYMLNG